MGNNNEKEAIEFEVMIHDAGPDKKARLKSMFNFLQDTIDIHARKQGTSVRDIEDLNLSWVYSRFYAEVKRYPELHERIQCRTWRSRLDKYQAYREFSILDSENKPLLLATSSLVLIDNNTRRPVPLNLPSSSLFETIPERAAEFSCSRIPELETYELTFRTHARYEDIDINSHMNNASYAQLFLESLPSMIGTYEIESIDISFRGEISYLDVITCLSDRGKEGEYYHKMINETKGIVSALAVTRWR